MRKVGIRICVGIFFVVVVLVIYTIWDNNRITVAEQEIVIDDLPTQLEDFSILQVSDLHEKEFGEDQKRLIETINAIDYDAIVFTGDMLDSTRSTNFKPFYSILDGIKNKENAWYVPGNADPYSYKLDPSIRKSQFIKGMEKRGVKLLGSIDSVTINGANIHFVNFELSIIKGSKHVGSKDGVVKPPYASDERYLDYQKQLWEDVRDIEKLNGSYVVVALNHYPVVDARVDYIKNNPHTVWNDFDLIIAGHYHGGQIRLPFIGALFVPEPWYKNSIFPPQDRVKGLWEYKQTKQYVSTGLGSSDAIPFLKFRLFNPPEINLLTFKR